MLKQLRVNTNSRTEFIDITQDIQKLVGESNVRTGVCCLSVPHTTAAITINENADPSVIRDIIKGLNKAVPFDNDYTHSEGNSAAHIKSSIIGASTVLIIEEGRLVLGTWQAVYFCEFDGPRDRRVLVKVVKD
jgi:secondary thiamine-phosphate synthase enzyme